MDDSHNKIISCQILNSKKHEQKNQTNGSSRSAEE